ncbi:alpha/beta fold hydrolase [Actinoplanes sp. DH11]|uniref:alpha/beta fold hydrolase n=1 Tax=Actinoplanes sp. DH11 TaxID=2857011 RepID=UPI001E4B3057|nr:alpha/beta fold hydrolase [Actinoplanes sp. DH11]
MRTVSRVLLVVLLTVCGTVTTAASPATAATLPGLVLTNAATALPAELAPLATGRRIQYVTTGVTGGVITATGLVLTPKSGKNNKIVAWGHGTTGLADQCAPSSNQGVFWEEARIAVAELLSRGWTVTAPDYPGLGTVQAHPYLIGASAGRSLIDSVRAARNLDASLGTGYVVDGHSQGGQGALFASQLAPSYDGNLVLKGTASIAPVSNTEQITPYIAGTEGQGYLVMALYGLAAVDTGFNPYSVLAAPAEAKTGVLQTGCLYEILNTYRTFTDKQLVTGGTVPPAVVARMAALQNPAQTAPSAPVLIVHGTADEAVPYFLSADYLVPQIQAYGVAVDFLGIAGANHDQAVIDSAEYVADWIAGRFA